jgi:hypothetical protein
MEAAKPITTRLMLARKTLPRRSQLPMLQEVSGRMKAVLPANHEFRGDGELLDYFFIEFAASCRQLHFVLA